MYIVLYKPRDFFTKKIQRWFFIQKFSFFSDKLFDDLFFIMILCAKYKVGNIFL